MSRQYDSYITGYITFLGNKLSMTRKGTFCATWIDVSPPISGVPVPEGKVSKLTKVCKGLRTEGITRTEARVDCINVKTQIDWALGEQILKLGAFFNFSQISVCTSS